MSSPSVPSFNIFVMMNSPEKKEKKEKKKENKLAEALKLSNDKDDEMIETMKAVAKKVGSTSHVGGG